MQSINTLKMSPKKWCLYFLGLKISIDGAFIRVILILLFYLLYLYKMIIKDILVYIYLLKNKNFKFTYKYLLF